jgi:hypothetical protein
VFKDLPMHGKRVGIYIDTKRLRCTVRAVWVEEFWFSLPRDDGLL